MLPATAKKLKTQNIMKVSEHGRTWSVLEQYDFTENDWIVGDFDKVGTIYMNNCNGYIVLFERNGRILMSDI